MPLSSLVTNPVKTAKRLVDGGEWEKIIALDRKNDLLQSDPRTMTSVLVAALEVGDLVAIKRVVSFCLDREVDSGLRLAVATRLLTWGHPDLAWSILAVVRDPQNLRQFVALCHRVSMKTKDAETRDQARARFSGLVGMAPAAGEDAAPKPFAPANLAERQYPSQSSAVFQPGHLSVLRGERVASVHGSANEALWAKFQAAVARVPAPHVYRFEDVLVNRLGQVWRPNGEVIVSCNRPVPVLNTEVAVPEFDAAVLCTNATRGFFHWYAERLPSLSWYLTKETVDTPVLFGDHAGRFQEETMSLLGRPARQVARIGDVARCRTVYIGRNSIAGLSEWQRFGFIYDTLANHAAQQVERRFGHAIYISRRDTNRRIMENEAELEARLTEMGVQCLSFSELSLAEQIVCTRGAKVMIGAHGAGLTHILAANPGLRVLEIMPSQPGFHSLRFNYARISYTRGHDHTLWLEPINPVSRNWSVSLQPFCDMVRVALQKAR